MNTTPTPRTDKAAYYMGREGSDRDSERWCDLLNESRSIERESADSVHASLAETYIMDSLREYREGLERRLRSLSNAEVKRGDPETNTIVSVTHPEKSNVNIFLKGDRVSSTDIVSLCEHGPATDCWIERDDGIDYVEIGYGEDDKALVPRSSIELP